MFQFHIGAIRRLKDLKSRVNDMLFQFHIGAIRRASSSRPSNHGTSFNSILVQLEVGGTISSTQVESLFQFHIGAIRRAVL